MNIKDYLHLYLGCEVHYPDTDGSKVKSVLTGVTNEEVETTYRRKKNGIKGHILSWKSNGHHDSNALNLKPILRPLSDMTEEEFDEIAQEFTDIEPSEFFANYETWFWDACENLSIKEISELNRRLLSKHFDLFGLIDAGLAIDKTKEAVK